MPCAISRREIVLVFLVGIAYIAPSQLRDTLFEKLFPDRVQKKKFSNDLLVEDISVGDVNEHADDIDNSVWKPPRPEETMLGLYKNKRELVHVIHTRFMQFQPDLKSLGKARIELFKTFTLPSVLQQTEQEFLWIIWMEPHLQIDLKEDFLDLVREIPNCVVIGSREKEPFIRSDFFQDLLESHVFSGNFDLLMDYHEAAQSRTVLHTELDADDALFYDFVKALQRDAKDTLASSQLKYDFRLWCVRKRLEWGFFNPWNEDAEEGYLVGKESSKECPPGGYTKGYGVETVEADLPQESRHEVHSKTPQCDYTQHKCIGRIYNGATDYAVLRSRTPTAHGMTDVMPKSEDPKLKDSIWKNKQEDSWDRLPKSFGTNKTAVTAMRMMLEEDMVNIILENLEGQCKTGFSCKHSTKQHLKELKSKYKKPIEEQKLKDVLGGGGRD